MRALLPLLLLACGSATRPSPSSSTSAPPPRPERDLQQEPREREDHAAIAQAHRKIEEEQQDALAMTCDSNKPTTTQERCLPSCYPTEPVDARAGKKRVGPTEIPHLVCETPGAPGAYFIADEIMGNKLALLGARGRFPKPHKPGTWQARVEAAVMEHTKLPAHDAIVVAGTWRPIRHPLVAKRVRCVRVSHYAKAMQHPLDGCGSEATLGCEAIGDPAARGINVVHYRLLEARRLQSAGKAELCQQAALEAVAVARGLPRWRQYAKLNVGAWKTRTAYRTRLDGVIDEDTLFEVAASLGKQAEDVLVACGGPAGAATTAEQEQSFHACWAPAAGAPPKQ